MKDPGAAGVFLPTSILMGGVKRPSRPRLVAALLCGLHRLLLGRSLLCGWFVSGLLCYRLRSLLRLGGRLLR